MKNNQDFNIVSFKKYVKNKENAPKPVLQINGIKDVATVLGPNAKNYRLSRNLRNLQQKGRKAIALASLIAISIGGVSLYSHATNTNEAIMEEDSLNQDNLFDNAEDKLKTYVLGKNYEDKYNNAKVDYVFDKSDGSKTLRVTYDKTKDDAEVKYVYTHTPKLLSSNDKDVTDLLNLMLNRRNKSLSKKKN